jgi:SAM-dependent methyltransferase
MPVAKIYRASRLPVCKPLFTDLPRAQGYIEALEVHDERLHVIGWMLHPDQAFDAVKVYFNGKAVLTTPLIAREDVGRVVHWVPHALHSGFYFKLPTTRKERKETTRIDLVGCAAERPLAHLGSLVNPAIYQLPVPPPEYCQRVSNMTCPYWFRVGGLKTFSDYVEALCRHRKFRRVRRVLDWGCGCGRVTSHFLAIANGPEVFGCDIDREMIAWANENLRHNAFSAIDPMPPTSYPDNFFDVIISYSVLTHLTRDVQHAWLAEMRRILAPGGLFLASVQGMNAAQYHFGQRHPQLPEGGIADEMIDHNLDGVAPEGYYRHTCQTPQFTCTQFSKHFHILEYVEQGALNYQDLVVMERPMERPKVSLSQRLLRLLMGGKEPTGPAGLVRNAGNPLPQ